MKTRARLECGDKAPLSMRELSWFALFARRLAALQMALSLLLLASLAQAQTKRDLVIWGMAYGPDTKGQEALNKEFERLHPDIRLRVLGMGAGGMSSQKLLTSIVGDVAPDIVLQDRFTVADWASRGAFLPLDDLIRRDLGKDSL